MYNFFFQVAEDNKPITDVYYHLVFCLGTFLKEQVQKIVLKMTMNWMPSRPEFPQLFTAYIYRRGSGWFA